MNRDNWNRENRDQYSNWQNANRQEEENRNRGGFTGRPGSNYASGSFSGIGYGRGLQEDKYRGYNNTGNFETNFANKYNAKYGEEYNAWNRGTHDYKDDNRNRRVNYIPDNDDNRSSLEQYRTSNHKGKGPRGYHRSDERILEDINDLLSDDPYVDASDIEVKIEDGNAILSGHVDSRQTKRRAEDIAESVRGVTNVENRLRVGEGIMENTAKTITSTLGDVTLGQDKDRR
jgi:osmotically-inducible protein OsmY